MTPFSYEHNIGGKIHESGGSNGGGSKMEEKESPLSVDESDIYYNVPEFNVDDLLKFEYENFSITI